MSESTTQLTKIVWVLNRVNGFGPQKFKRLLEVVQPMERIAERQTLRELRRLPDWSRLMVDQIEVALESSDFEREEARCYEQGFSIVSLVEEIYPKLLKSIYDPPLILYVAGTLVPEDEVAIAMVGSRQPTYYGIKMAEEFSSDLAARGITVVSGMARGIDTASHRGALKASGRTIAVLGSGLDVIYPKENEALFEHIREQGAVVSEFPLGTPPLARHFPLRNRIIGGLSMGALVVEASQKSGSLITASSALDEGREVYAIPGPVGSVTSSGTNELIQKGAKLVTSVEQILEDMAPLISASAKSWAGAGEEISREIQPARACEEAQPEDDLISLLSSTPVYLDQIFTHVNQPQAEVSARLLEYEITGQVKRVSGGGYVKKGVKS